ncbi:hypothetical protein M405DRAFT_408073 [Rhizopogon salebrosus TDB-379]|nr:hypothetical protein M405DRAFT_408073 [Rhizopogon salebrosus TDB-379]
MYLVRTPRSGSIDTVQLRRKLILRTISICMHTNYCKPPRILSIVPFARIELPNSRRIPTMSFLNSDSLGSLISALYLTSAASRSKPSLPPGIQGMHICVVPDHTSATQVIVRSA